MIDSKQSFLAQVRSRCAEELTAADMERLMVILSDTMEGFRVEELKADGWTANDDDLVASFVSSLSVQGRSQKTIDRYVYIIGRFMKAANTSARAVTVYHIRDFYQEGMIPWVCPSCGKLWGGHYDVGSMTWFKCHVCGAEWELINPEEVNKNIERAKKPSLSIIEGGMINGK